MGFCTLEPPSIKIIYFIGYISFAFLREKLEDKLDLIFLDKRAEYFEFTIFYTLGDLLCFFFALIVKKRTLSKKIEIKKQPKKSSNKININIDTTLIYNEDKSPKNKYILLKRILYLSIYDILAQSCIIIFSFIYTDEESKMPHHNTNLTLIFDIIIRFILNKIILGSEFYPHYYLSISICILSFIILSISDLYYVITVNDIPHWIYLLQTILGLILYSFEDVEGKIGLNYEFLNPYNLLFYKGVMQFIFLIIVSIIFIIFKQFYLFTGLFDNKEYSFNILTFIIVVAYIINNMLSNICIWKIIDFFSIQHLTIIKGGSFFSFYIKALIRKQLNYQREDSQLYLFYFTDIGGYILILIGTLIHNEIIILNCGNLNKYTYKKLKEREQKDFKTIDEMNSSFGYSKKESGETLKSSVTLKQSEILKSNDTLKSSETLKSKASENFNENNKSTSILEESVEF